MSKKRKHVTVEEMRQHVEGLCEKHDIILETRWVKRADRAYALRERDGGADEINISPIRSTRSYATALHEIGHIKGRYQDSRSTMVRERWAWRWARANALIWTHAIERDRRKSLAHYARRKKAGHDHTPPTTVTLFPADGHIIRAAAAADRALMRWPRPHRHRIVYRWPRLGRCEAH